MFETSWEKKRETKEATTRSLSHYRVKKGGLYQVTKACMYCGAPDSSLCKFHVSIISYLFNSCDPYQVISGSYWMHKNLNPFGVCLHIIENTPFCYYPILLRYFIYNRAFPHFYKQHTKLTINRHVHIFPEYFFHTKKINSKH